ncbi:MAG: hypothetical protein ACYC6Y_29585 [Thermoguttaceae bacterium]
MKPKPDPAALKRWQDITEVQGGGGPTVWEFQLFTPVMRKAAP